MTLVVLSIAVLLLAPLIAGVLGKRPALASMLDSFVLVTVGGIVALHVVPQSALIAGPSALVVAAVGLFLPILLHRLDERLLAEPHSAGRAARDVVLLVVFIAGVFVHGMFDGTALAGGPATSTLAFGVLLHRLPVGLALWVVVRPKLGMARMLFVVGAYASGTILGGFLGEALSTAASTPALALLQAFVGGSILHIVAETPPYKKSSESSMTTSRVTGALGAIIAALALYALERTHEEHELALGLSSASTFLALAFHIAPAALLSFLLVGALTALYPDGAPKLPSRGPVFFDSLAGVVAGLPHPLCSCSVAPLYTTLVDRGTSPVSARAFLVAAPELGVPAVLLTAALMGLPFTAARVIGVALVALFVGASAFSLSASTPTSSAKDDARKETLQERALRGFRHGFVDAVDHILPWMLLGLGIAALIEPSIAEDALKNVSAPLQTISFSLAALPLYLCAAGSTPIAFLLLHKGASAGAALAFLLVGPVTSLPTLALLKKLHGTRSTVLFASLVVAGACAAGIIVDLVFPVGEDSMLNVVDNLHAQAATGPSTFEVCCVVVLGGLLLSSLVRQGIRGFLVQIMSPQHTHAADHAHGPGCGHDHGPPEAVRIHVNFNPRGP